MRREYSQECSESESASNALMAQERRDKKDQLTQAKNADKLDKERASIRQQQCGELKRILFSKRARTDLTDGEKVVSAPFPGKLQQPLRVKSHSD